MISATWRLESTSIAPARSCGRRNGRRSAGSSVSDWRSQSHSTDSAENTAKAPKMPRQPVTAMIAAPSDGARAGTMVNTIITKDMSCAIRRPS